MVLHCNDNVCGGHEKIEQHVEKEYLQNTSGLFLNATSIISGTCSRNKQELERASRIAGSESPTKSPAKVNYHHKLGNKSFLNISFYSGFNVKFSRTT